MRYTTSSPQSHFLLLVVSVSLSLAVITNHVNNNNNLCVNAAFISPASRSSLSSSLLSKPSNNAPVRLRSAPSSSTSTATLPYTATSTKTTTSTSTSSTSSTTPPPVEDQEEEEEESEEERAFKLRTRELCDERNFKFQKVKNARDLNSVRNSPILPGRIIRTGRVSDATDDDLAILNGIGAGVSSGIKTYVDLRSYTELKDDPVLDRTEVFDDYTDLVWVERKGNVKVLNDGRSRVEKKKNIVGHVKELVGGAKKGIDVATHFRNETSTDSTDSTDMPVNSDGSVDGGLLNVLTSAADLAEATDACKDGDCDDEEIDDLTSTTASTTSTTSTLSSTQEDEIEDLLEGKKKKRYAKVYHSLEELVNDESRSDAKERHFVSIMNEMKYVKGTLGKVRKRDLAKAIIKSPGAIVSRRVRSSCKDVFLNRINDGGLHMLNELLLKHGAPGIKYVLNLCKDRSRHPIAFYCTAGKDRTGMIAAIMLAAAGVPDEDIVEDYSLSANVYAEMNDHKAMVGALSQRNLDAKTFLGAPPEVMRDTLIKIRSTYGSMEAYLDKIGFNEEDRKELRSALLDP